MANLADLKKPFPPEDINWRIGQAGKKQSGQIWAKVLAYVDNRLIQDRLDDVVGPENWKNDYMTGPQGGVLCGLSIKIGQEWVTKWDGAENTDIESVKGGLSDAMKRAAVQWGIARYLYELGETWAEVSDNGENFAHCQITVKGAKEWVDFRWSPPKNALNVSKPAKPAPLPEKQEKVYADKPAPLNTGTSMWVAQEIAKLAVATGSDLMSIYKSLCDMQATAERNKVLLCCLQRRIDLANEEERKAIYNDISTHTPDIVDEMRKYCRAKRGG